MASEINVKVDTKAKTLTITLPLEENPVASKSGKNLTVASTRGNFRSDAEVDGKPVTVGVNAYIPAN